METPNEAREADITLDDLMGELGNFGRFQLYSCSLTCLTVIFAALSSLSYIFIAGEVRHRCLVPECEGANASYDASQSWLKHAMKVEETPDGPMPDECSRYAPSSQHNASDGPNPTCPASLFTLNSISCDAYVYDNSTLSIVNEWGLVCDDAWKRTLVGTICNLGQLVGLPIAGYLSDKLGRRTVVAAAATLCAAVGLGRSFVNEYYSLVVLEFLEPAFGIGIYSAAFVLCLELVDAHGRVAMGVALNSSFALGETLLGGLAWALGDWRMLSRVIYTPGLIFVIYAWLLPEPVRWLMARGRQKEARSMLERAARCNRKTLDPQRVDRVFSPPVLPERQDTPLSKAGTDDADPSSLGEKPATFVSILRSRILLARFLNLCYCWLTNTFVFYGLSLFSVTIAGNVYRNFMLASAIEMPAYLAMLFVTDRAGRRWCVCGGLAMSGCGCFVLMCPLPAPAQVTFLLVSKFCITLAFAVLYVYAAELFPTPVRHSVLSTCAMLGRIGAVAAPMTPLLATMVNRLLPVGLFASMAVAAALLTLLLPETVHLPLPSTVAEAENLGRARRRPPGPRTSLYGSTGATHATGIHDVPSVPNAPGAPYLPPHDLHHRSSERMRLVQDGQLKNTMPSKRSEIEGSKSLNKMSNLRAEGPKQRPEDSKSLTGRLRGLSTPSENTTTVSTTSSQERTSRVVIPDVSESEAHSPVNSESKEDTEMSGSVNFIIPTVSSKGSLTEDLTRSGSKDTTEES